MISWAVMGHPARQREATALAWALGGQLALDEDQAGENATGDRAWSLYDPAASWHVVLQDDAIPIATIHDQAAAALAHAPHPIVSLYLGTGYPGHTIPAMKAAIRKADAAGAAWITSRRLFWGVAVAIRTELVDDMLTQVQRIRRPYDERISAWTDTIYSRVAYTWPSLVDHADGPPLVDRLTPRVLPRKAYRTGSPETWDTTHIPM